MAAAQSKSSVTTQAPTLKAPPPQHSNGGPWGRADKCTTRSAGRVLCFTVFLITGLGFTKKHSGSHLAPGSAPRDTGREHPRRRACKRELRRSRPKAPSATDARRPPARPRPQRSKWPGHDGGRFPRTPHSDTMQTQLRSVIHAYMFGACRGGPVKPTWRGMHCGTPKLTQTPARRCIERHGWTQRQTFPEQDSISCLRRVSLNNTFLRDMGSQAVELHYNRCRRYGATGWSSLCHARAARPLTLCAGNHACVMFRYAML